MVFTDEGNLAELGFHWQITSLKGRHQNFTLSSQGNNCPQAVRAIAKIAHHAR
jgi:hypothetical protein